MLSSCITSRPQPIDSPCSKRGEVRSEATSEAFSTIDRLGRKIAWSAPIKTFSLSALEAGLRLPTADANKVVVIGHSEGAISVASLAAANPKVTEVVMLSGNGANQLFDFIVGKSQDEISQVYRDCDFISTHPEDTETMFWAHPAKRWASFFRNSSADFLVKTKARVPLVHGTKDTSIPIASFDFLVSELKRKGRTFDFKRLQEANHSLNFPGESKATGMRREFTSLFIGAGIRRQNLSLLPGPSNAAAFNNSFNAVSIKNLDANLGGRDEIVIIHPLATRRVVTADADGPPRSARDPGRSTGIPSQDP